jgi:hypothetical protein
MTWQLESSDSKIAVNLQQRGSDGAVWGTLAFDGITYSVHGTWQLAGILGRTSSNIYLRGAAAVEQSGCSYVVMSGLVHGAPPNTTSMDVGLNQVSTLTGEVQSVYETLNPVSLGAPPGGSPEAPPSHTADIPWSLKSVDGSTGFSGRVSSAGDAAGIMTFGGQNFPVGGAWASAGAAPRLFSCMQLTGAYGAVPNQPSNNYLTVCASVKNFGVVPQAMDIAGNMAAITAWQNTPVDVTLLPTMNRAPDALQAAYSESYMVLRIGGPGGDSQAVAGWTGPGGSVVSPFGTGDYASAGVAMSPATLSAIVKPDTTSRDATYDIDIPTFTSTATSNRSVMIQFLGEFEHFVDPPLMAYHEQIAQIFYDEEAGALVLQFLDNANVQQETSPINFNHQSHLQPKNHDSVIIESFR